MNTKTLIIAGFAICFLFTVGQAIAARYIVVNGQRLNDAEIQHLDRLSCGNVPNGHYWLNMSTGIWGYENGGAEGHISDNCNSHKPGLSERGLLYSPGELFR